MFNRHWIWNYLITLTVVIMIILNIGFMVGPLVLACLFNNDWWLALYILTAPGVVATIDTILDSRTSEE